MRVRTFFTINNQYKDEVFYGMYEPDDKTFAKTDAGHEGWLEAGKAIEMEVPFRKCKIVFWKGRPFVGVGEKLADPKEVTTDRPVTLTKDKKVEQPAEADFTDPEHTGAVVFLTEMQGNNIIRGLVMAGIGKIPEIGGAISGILGFVWPEQKPDLIAESEARMKKWVQGRFEAYDRQFLQNTLTGLRAHFENYLKAKGPGERARWFDIVLAACEGAMPHFTKSPYTPGTIDLATSVATLHLALLRERVLFARQIFEDKEINEAHFKESLKKTIAAYQRFIKDVAIPGELKWRDSQISSEKGIGDRIYLTDWVTREVHGFSKSGRSQLSQGPSKVCADYYREQARSSLARQLHENIYHTSLFWTLLDPDQKNAKPVALDSLFWNGPLAGLGYMEGNEHNFSYGDSVEEKTGRLTEIVVYAGDKIDGLQFNADKRLGKHYGGFGGKRYFVHPPAGAFFTKVETWFDFDLFAIRFHFSDGSASLTFGTPGRGGVHQVAEFPRHHLTAVRVGKRLEELRCGFTPLPDYYEGLAR